MPPAGAAPQDCRSASDGPRSVSGCGLQASAALAPTPGSPPPRARPAPLHLQRESVLRNRHRESAAQVRAEALLRGAAGEPRATFSDGVSHVGGVRIPTCSTPQSPRRLAVRLSRPRRREVEHDGMAAKNGTTHERRNLLGKRVDAIVPKRAKGREGTGRTGGGQCGFFTTCVKKGMVALIPLQSAISYGGILNCPDGPLIRHPCRA